MQRIYTCAECQEPLKGTGEGLKTFKCQKHPFRFVTVLRDTSGGSEQLRDRRKEPVAQKRHTKVRTIHTK
jgi:hypothetical protein